MTNPTTRQSLRSFLGFLSIFLFHFAVSAEVKPPGIFGDHMVLQQDKTIPIWGTAAVGETITVSLGTATGKTTADGNGKWRVDLPAQPGTSIAQELVISGTNTLKFQDVLLGDVWLCSGQSNMGFTLKDAQNAATEIPKSADPQYRFFVVGRKTSGIPQTDVISGKWELCDPTSVPHLSAVAYFFGRELRQSLQRPIGLITTTWGGTPAEAWTSYSGLQKSPELAHYLEAYQQVQDRAAKVTPEMKATFEEKMVPWKSAFDASTAEWQKAVDVAKAAKQPLPPQPKPATPMPVNPDPFAFPPGFPNIPTCLFNGMVSPLIPYAIKGAIWYQGESHGKHPEEYRVLFPAMITDWREKWGEGDFPFLFVQLPAFQAGVDSWPLIREAQLLALSLPNTGMAITIDTADPGQLHPPNKLPVGLRLARAAHHVAYGEKVVGSGPIYDSMKIEGSAIRISFKANSIGGGLSSGPPALPAAATTHLKAFFLAGADQKFVPATATIDHDTLLISSEAVSAPIAVRYSWENIPSGNLYNKEGLPASPFRTDDWAAIPAPAAPAK